ncbi:MAG: hypothetical protein ACK4EX_07770 [Thermaurantimonas sp.]|uniref:hypothetical protein n=1 Tax=Thermaurantimonas sp. TaxID=2681568 RepID=UPI0039189F24
MGVPLTPFASLSRSGRAIRSYSPCTWAQHYLGGVVCPSGQPATPRVLQPTRCGSYPLLSLTHK